MLVNENWIDGSKLDNEHISFIEKSLNSDKVFNFRLPWYAATIRDDHDTFFPLESRLGKHWYDGYNTFNEELRLTTMLEF